MVDLHLHRSLAPSDIEHHAIIRFPPPILNYKAFRLSINIYSCAFSLATGDRPRGVSWTFVRQGLDGVFEHFPRNQPLFSYSLFS
jgi:hypothetical protein